MLTLSRAKTRRALIIPAVAAAALLQLLVVGTPAAHAADPTVLNVVGTSDVSDSNLIAAVIKPDFEAAYPQYTLNYIPKGTGAAITYAEAGTADALIVHAASVENQFVSNGYSLEPYGRAIFWGDYVLAGPTADPAGIGTAGDSQNIVKTFKDIATAGALGQADFVSRGGTPGTTIQEHAIWAQLAAVGEVPASLTLCTVSDANGGGMSPSTTSGTCPSTISYPSWYHVSGDTQGVNVNDANTCAGKYDSGQPGDCFVFTDRGTFEFVNPSNLKILTQNDTKTTEDPTGTLLVNSFHAYAVNPDKFSSGTLTDTTGATDLLNWLTSPTGQAKIGAYEVDPNTNLPAFRPDAMPAVTTNGFPDVVNGSNKVTLTGSVDNVVPGTPPLNDKLVTLMGQVDATPNAAPVVVASARTAADGTFSMTFAAPVERSYTLTTPALTKVENATLNPIFADQLQATTSALGSLQVQGALTGVKATGKGGAITVTGGLAPKVHGTGAILRLYAKIAGPGHGYHYVGGRKLSDGQSTFNFAFAQKARAYQYYVRYVNTGYIAAGQSSVGSVTVVS